MQKQFKERGNKVSKEIIVIDKCFTFWKPFWWISGEESLKTARKNGRPSFRKKFYDRSIFQWSKGQAYAYEKEKMFKEKVAKAFKNQDALAT